MKMNSWLHRISAKIFISNMLPTFSENPLAHSAVRMTQNPTPLVLWKRKQKQLLWQLEKMQRKRVLLRKQRRGFCNWQITCGSKFLPWSKITCSSNFVSQASIQYYSLSFSLVRWVAYWSFYLPCQSIQLIICDSGFCSLRGAQHIKLLSYLWTITMKFFGVRRDTPFLHLLAQKRQYVWLHKQWYHEWQRRHCDFHHLKRFLYIIPGFYILMFTLGLASHFKSLLLSALSELALALVIWNMVPIMSAIVHSTVVLFKPSKDQDQGAGIISS